jgi:hypothetical protein
MTDLAPTADATRSCPRCGEQNPVFAGVCEKCGEVLPPAVGREAERGDLEVLEVERAASVAGFDTEFTVDGDALTCPVCRHVFRLDEVRINSTERAQDTASGGEELDVITCTCPSCGTSGHAVTAVAPTDEGDIRAT